MTPIQADELIEMMDVKIKSQVSLKEIGAAMSFMSQVSMFEIPMGRRGYIQFVGAHYEGHEWLATTKDDLHIFMRDAKFVTVCEKILTPIMETLQLIENGTIDPPRNITAIQLQDRIGIADLLVQWGQDLSV